MMISDLVEVYCLASNLTTKIDLILEKNSSGRKPILSRAEYITLAIIKQKRGIQTNKNLYELVKYSMKSDFPQLPSYQQFCEGLESNCIYLLIINQLLGKLNISCGDGNYIVDSTPLPICKVMHSNKKNAGYGIANYGKNLEGWFFGFKLHLIITIDMEIVSFKFTKGSTSDLNALDEWITQDLKGNLFGDKGYISSKKNKKFVQKGLHLVTRPRKNMKKLPADPLLVSLLAMRQRVETVFGQLKNTFMLINRKTRSIQSFFANTLASMFAYTISKKPEICYLKSNAFDHFLIS